MKKNLIVIVIALVIFIIFLSCTKKSETQVLDSKTSEFGVEKLKLAQPEAVKNIEVPEMYEEYICKGLDSNALEDSNSVKFEKVIDEANLNEKCQNYELKGITSLEYLYPQIFKGEIDSLRKIILESFNMFSFNVFDSLHAEYVNTNNSYDNTLAMHIVCNKNNLLCLEYYSSLEYSGQFLHGVFYTNYLTIDLENMKVLTIPELFKIEHEKELLDLVYNTFDKDALFDDSEKNFFLSKNFYISNKGVGFLYNIYEIAPFVAGPQEAFLLFENIPKHLIADNSIILRFIK